MILVDTSVWIELLNGKLGYRVTPQALLQFSTTGPIVQEVRQGLREGAGSGALGEALLALPRLSDPLPFEMFLEAAELFRQGRRRGYTIRSGVDCLIATVAIQNRVPVWHQDRDFTTIARYTSLRTWSPREKIH